MPKYKRGSGSVYLKRGWCYIKYYADGKPVYEATGTKNKAEARRMLQARLGQLAEGRFTGPAADRVTFEELAEGLIADYKANARKTLQDVEIRIRKHLAPVFGGRKAHQITSADVRTYSVQRQEQGASNGQINRELAALKRMFNIAFQEERIAKKPHIPTLEENNVRQGFFEAWEFDAILAKLPEYLRPAFTFAYHTGWRTKSEVLRLRWEQIDLEVRAVRLEVGTTKNKDGRLIYLMEELQQLLESQWQEHLAEYPDCPLVFHNRGKPIVNYSKAWRKACREAGLEGKMAHDFRRTAVRNMVRAGISERVAMQMSGHKTRSVFDRYHIVSDGDLREAAQRLNTAFSRQTVTTLVTTPSLTDQEVPVSH